ncbi:MAG: twin-arginine translocation signal domain-containing protein, partial [Anaerolineae bacterium]
MNRRDLLKLMAAGAGATAIAPMFTGMPSPVFAQRKKRKVIFVTHDLNPFFVPAIVGLKDFGSLAGWDTEFIGPPVHDT